MRRLAVGSVLLALVLLLSGGCKRSRAETAQSRELYANACARCHGADGAGGAQLWDGGPSPRNFHDHGFQTAHSDEDLKATIKNGKGSGMPAFGVLFDDAQIVALVDQVRSFDP